MRVFATITEFSPFHRGHQHLLHRMRKMDPDLIIVITSNYFTQRGLPSLLTSDKKTRLTLLNGADLVIELPELYTLQSADCFAKAAIQSLSSCKVTHLVFGSESADLAFLEKLADEIDFLKKNPTASQSLITSLQKISLEKFQRSLSSNDLLGVQYVYWCRQYGIQPVCIQRDSRFESATSLRKEIFSAGNWVYQSITRESFQLENLYPFIRYCLVTTSPTELSRRLLMKEGIENRLKVNAFENDTFENFLNASISKSYTKARIQRTCICALLQIDQMVYQKHPDFFEIIPLGFDEKGRNYLKTLDKNLVLSARRYWPDYLKAIRLKSRFVYELMKKDPGKEELIIV